MLKAYRQWLDSVILICLVALLISPMGPSGYLHTLLQGPCMHHPRKIQVTSADPKPALRFLQGGIASVLYPSQPLLFTPSSRNPLVHLGPDC